MKTTHLQSIKLKGVLPLCFLLLTTFSSTAQDWVNVKTFQPGQTLHCIRFANNSVGYTVSSLYNGTTYNIHKTEDGGNTWIDQSSGYTSTRFKDIFVFSEDTVMMCGNYGLVIHTLDGGENWIADTVSPDGDHLFGISFVGQTGYVCGNSGAIYKTTNMGESWSKVDPPFITAIEEINFLTEDFGFICGLNFIYYTENGGETWIEPETFPGATTNWWLRQISFANDSVGFVCGDIGQIYMTTDRGKNWEWMENTPTSESLQAMIALDENNLFACGYAGTVMRSTDGAKNWELMSAASPQHFYGMDFTPEGVGFICTQIGEVLRYTDPYLSVPETELSNSLSVYPNPASNILTIEAKSFIKTIQFYNISGCLVYECASNSNQQQINVSGFDPGFYFLRIETRNGNFVKQLVVE